MRWKRGFRIRVNCEREFESLTRGFLVMRPHAGIRHEHGCETGVVPSQCEMISKPNTNVFGFRDQNVSLPLKADDRVSLCVRRPFRGFVLVSSNRFRRPAWS